MGRCQSIALAGRLIISILGSFDAFKMEFEGSRVPGSFVSRNILPALPDGYVVRAPRSEEAQVITDLLAACEVATTGKSEITLNDFLGDWEGANLEADARVILDPAGNPAAYVDIDVRGDVIFNTYAYVHPSQRGFGLGSYLVAWAEQRAMDIAGAAPAEARIVTRHFVNERDAPATQLLTTTGYQAVRITYTMAIDLTDTPPQPVWPEGLAVRTFQSGHDEEATYLAYEEAFEDMWQRPRSTLEQFLSKTRRPYFDPSLWFLAVDGDEIAGTLLSDDIDGNGWIEIVGVRRPWRSRGLALALLLHAFGAFYKRGVTHIGLSVDSMSPTGAPRVYQRAGMQLDQTFVLYERELRPGTIDA